MEDTPSSELDGTGLRVFHLSSSDSDTYSEGSMNEENDEYYEEEGEECIFDGSLDEDAFPFQSLEFPPIDEQTIVDPLELDPVPIFKDFQTKLVLPDKDALDDDIARSNMKLCRFVDITPFNHSLVQLANPPLPFINASHVHLHGERYILTQWPIHRYNFDETLTNTEGHYWQMVYEKNIELIVVLQNPTTYNQPYWPIETGVCETFGDAQNEPEHSFNVKLLCFEEYEHYLTCHLRVSPFSSSSSSSSFEYKYCTLFLFRDWPDHGIPRDFEGLFQIFQHIQYIREKSGRYSLYRRIKENESPIAVHCRAGVGRAGVFSVLHSILCHPAKGFVDIEDTIVEARRSRCEIVVQTKEQFYFVKCMIQRYKNELNVKSLSSNYEKRFKKNLNLEKERFYLSTKLTSSNSNSNILKVKTKEHKKVILTLPKILFCF